MVFNENLKLLLLERRLKQADLCRLTKIKSSLMSEYVNGKKSPAIGNAILIADALDISLDTLVGRKEKVRYREAVHSPYGCELNEEMNGLSEKEYDFMLDVMRALRRLQ